jgi:dipeptidyl aminopeptidase/acylaminoacyl peptidase
VFVPNSQYGNTVFHDLQWHAARGYVVMYGNPRGSANLLIHSEGDWRCPIGQSQELFSALKRLGKCPVELVWYPPETSHGMSRGGPPDLRQDRLARYAEWFDRYLKV